MGISDCYKTVWRYLDSLGTIPLVSEKSYLHQFLVKDTYNDIQSVSAELSAVKSEIFYIKKSSEAILIIEVLINILETLDEHVLTFCTDCFRRQRPCISKDSWGLGWRKFIWQGEGIYQDL